MDKNKSILIAALYLKEASDLLKTELYDVSTLLLKVSKSLLDLYKIDEDSMLSALNIIDTIKGNI